ncbi:MAG: HNH endonuclease [Candidatus Promineifilaceae bacterium]|nr:HNH endonuclease [Candidatus Promineifilaceae bacterium]
MADEIIAYLEMCQREGVSLQKGMNYRLAASHSVLLMSRRPNAPYRDEIVDDGTTLIYEGHDVPRSETHPNPKVVDQPEFTASGSLTENGKFHGAAQEYKKGSRPPERVRVYEKIRQGIWSYNGLFHLIDSWREQDENRSVFKFKLKAVDESVEGDPDQTIEDPPSRRRVVPTEVKLEVWKRDKGQCVQCGATDELHFDHIIPFSKGGTSIKAENVQLLCARHNLEKSDYIL